MSSWCALNVSYEDDTTSDDVDTWLSQVNSYQNSSDGFDVLLSVFTHGEEHGAVIVHLVELAKEAGETECVVSVAGNDTADIFTVKYYDGDGAMVEEWSGDLHGYDPFHRENDVVPLMQQVEDDLGRRPDLGGNYAAIGGDE